MMILLNDMGCSFSVGEFDLSELCRILQASIQNGQARMLSYRFVRKCRDSSA